MSVNRSVVRILRVLGIGVVAVVALAAWPDRPARAFCGFFVAGSDAKLTNNASQVVLMRKGNRTVMTLSNTYQGPLENFAMVVPVPVVLQRENVKTLPFDVFDRVDSLSAPRLVEYWEQDPCGPRVEDDRFYGAPVVASKARSDDLEEGEGKDLGVRIEAKFVAGEYQILILSATDSAGLETWLRREKYNVPRGAAGALAPYIRDKSKFFVAKIDIKKVARNAQGIVQLSPLRFYFDANELRLPVRLGLLNATGKQDLIVYVIHPQSRFEVANYANAFIPTNLEVAGGVRANFPGFFAELFDATVERMGRKVVVTEYSWQTTSCDPCPTPPLSTDDLATLGLDVLEGIGASPPAPAPSIAGTTKPSVEAHERQRAQLPPPPFYGNAPSWVLTRLHARYSKETLAEDLIFRAAEPVIGGRANGNGVNGDEGAQIEPGGDNNFQGRYIIRNYWTGPVACENPQYESWGGPPGAPYGAAQTTAAKGLATAPRGKIVLTSEVRSPVPLLGIAGKAPPRRQPQKAK